jgi:hypothetical protein
MKSTIVAIISLVAAVTAAPDPLITPRAELAPRQHVHDPELVGWVDAINGQCKLKTHFSTSTLLPLYHLKSHN